MEPELEKHFHPDSYSYHPGKSAVEAVGVARERCWFYDWVLDLDISTFFDSIDHLRTEAEAGEVKKAVYERLAECGLILNPQKTQIV
ncbi:MAG: hypothetical protein U0937_03720 [Thermodesulfovibrionia bacterium]|nr:hypothetical protein [Thermodesulfovibrionia bacterium]